MVTPTMERDESNCTLRFADVDLPALVLPEIWNTDSVVFAAGEPGPPQHQTPPSCRRPRAGPGSPG